MASEAFQKFLDATTGGKPGTAGGGGSGAGGNGNGHFGKLIKIITDSDVAVAPIHTIIADVFVRKPMRIFHWFLFITLNDQARADYFKCTPDEKRALYKRYVESRQTYSTAVKEKKLP